MFAGKARRVLHEKREKIGVPSMKKKAKRAKRSSRKLLEGALNQTLAAILIALGCELGPAELLLGRALMNEDVQGLIWSSIGETISDCLAENPQIEGGEVEDL